MLSALLVSLTLLSPPACPQGNSGEKPTTETKQEKKDESQRPAAKRKITAEAWDDRRAKAAVKAFKKAMKGKPSMRDRNKALESLAKGSNKNLIKPLAGVAAKDKSIVIRKRAAELLGNQPPKQACKAILALLGNARVTSHPAVEAELVRSLSRAGYESKMWKHLEGEFERIYDLERVPLQEAILELIEAHAEKQALPLLLRNLDEPIPEDQHAPDNPGPEYWEARWKSWRIWRKKVKEALFAVTGQRFGAAAEAKAWLKKNPLR